jgi:hypothetical protein
VGPTPFASAFGLGSASQSRHFFGSNSKSESRESERKASDGPQVGLMYPGGFHQTPSSASRGYSPSPDRGGFSHSRAPLGVSGFSEASTPSTTPGIEATSYDYFRGRQ